MARCDSRCSFCLFGTRGESGVTATVIWSDGQQIIGWGGNDSALTESAAILHLKTDVVPAGNENLLQVS